MNLELAPHPYKEVETEFMPWMTDLVVAECSKAAAARKVVNDLIVKAIKDNLAAKAAGTASAKKSRADAAAADAAEVDAAAAAKAALEEKANTELAKEVLEVRRRNLDPPILKSSTTRFHFNPVSNFDCEKWITSAFNLNLE